MLTIYIIFIIFDLIAMGIAIAAEANVNNKYKKYSTIPCNNNLTGQEVAERILRENNITEISVNRIQGKLSDHYNHRKKELNLSEDVYSGTTIASIAVAAHEAGHAIQYKTGYFGIKLRNFVIPLSNALSASFLPILIIGIILSGLSVTLGGTDIGSIIIIISLVSLSASVLVNLVTLPVEFDASKRALKEIESMHIVDESELDGTKSMLKAAALTYVASLVISLVYLFRYALILFMLFGDKE